MPNPATPNFARDQFRVELLLHLPQLGMHVHPATNKDGNPSEVFPTLDLNDGILPDVDYDLEALAAWILGEFDRLDYNAAAAVAAAEHASAEVIEMATGAALISSSLEFASYLEQLADALKQNLGISQQWDLARSIGDEEGRLIQLASQLVARYPALAQSLPAAMQSVDGEALSSD